MQRDLRGQREAASGDLSERAARKDTGHGITFFRICTFAYRVRENRTWYNIKPNLYVQLPCSRKRSNAPFSNVRLQNRHGVLPNTVRELYMLGRCPKPKRGLFPLHPGRGRPRGRSIKHSDNLYDTFRKKDLHQYHSVQKFLRMGSGESPFF